MDSFYINNVRSSLKFAHFIEVKSFIVDPWGVNKGISNIMRDRWKVLGLAYVKLGTSGRWVGTQTGARVTTTLV